LAAKTKPSSNVLLGLIDLVSKRNNSWNFTHKNFLEQLEVDPKKTFKLNPFKTTPHKPVSPYENNKSILKFL